MVYHTVAVSVRQRRREFAVLNAVGVERRTLVTVCLVETIVLATIGIGLGLAGGRLLAALASASVGRAASDIWLRVDVSRHALGAMVAGVAVGLGTAITAAYLAIRATFEMPAVEALRPAAFEAEETRSPL